MKPEDLILSPYTPMDSARKFISCHYTQTPCKTLHHHKNSFYIYTGTHYREADDPEIRSYLYAFLDNAFEMDEDGILFPFQPNKHKVANVMEALKAVAFLSSDIEAPMWLEELNEIFPANEFLACKNGLLHLPVQEILNHTPTFFGYGALDFEYAPKAPAPQQWLDFLSQLWPDDPDSIRTLQEWFGYCLSTDTSQQKILMMVGPLRSGNGTIGRVQRQLLGKRNVCAPTLSSLRQNFGLQPLIGKQLAIISDARLDGRSGQAIVTERLLSISGEDALTIDRKYKGAWTGTLATQLMILTNELPRIGDASGALANRYIVLLLTESFLGREDPELTTRLLKELPGILNWAIEGWIRLQEGGHFHQPNSAAEAIKELHELGSPISAFIQDRCEIGPEFSVVRDDLYLAWCHWCQSEGHDHPGSRSTFGRDLRTAEPGIKDRRRRIAGVQKRIYEGIGLKKPGTSNRASFNPKVLCGSG